MWFNPIMKWLIASPLHFFVSKNTMLITYTGRKSGKTYSTPINYLRDGNHLYATSRRERVWWRSLRDGSPVRLLVQHKEIRAVPRLYEQQAEVEAQLYAYFKLAPKLARYYQVGLESSGMPKAEDIARAAASVVVVEFNVA
jgi:deazaflavin-dependent oxidoreductase (nitroreductase family)